MSLEVAVPSTSTPDTSPAHSQRAGFAPFHPDSKELLSDVHFSDTATFPQGAIPHVQIRTFDVEVRRGTAEVERYSRDYATAGLQDTLDLLCYFADRDSGTYFLGISHSFRPAILHRNTRDGSPLRALLLECLPGGYLHLEPGKIGLQELAEMVARDKLGSATRSSVEFLGGAYYASGGSLTELCHPRALEVARPAHLKQLKTGTDFQPIAVSEFVPLQEVIDRYFSGELRDVRALEAAMRFARFKGVDFEVPIEVDRTKGVSESVLPRERILSIEDVHRILHLPETADDAAVSIRLVENLENGKKTHFLKRSLVNAQGTRRDGTLTEPICVEIVERSGVDSIDVGAYCIIDEKPYLLVTSGERELTLFRDQSFHPLTNDSDFRYLDGLSTTLPAGAPLDNRTTERARISEYLDSIGVRAAGTPTFLNHFYVSAGWANEGVAQYLTPIEVDRNSLSWNRGINLISAEDVLLLSDAGEVPSARLTSLAHILLKCCHQALPERSLSAPELRYLESANSTPKIQSALSRLSPEYDGILTGHVLYRKLKAFGANELGLTIREADEISCAREERLFNEAFPLIILYKSHGSPQRWPLNFFHDLSHYLKGELIPFKFDASGKLAQNPDGSPAVQSRELYTSIVRDLEAEANFNSDYLTTKVLGVESVAKVSSQRGRVFEAMHALGLTDEQAREVMREIELKGKVPEEVKTHPLFDRFRDVFVDRLLYFHVLDRFQADLGYDGWMRYPRLAEVACHFEGFYSDGDRYRDDYFSRLQMLREYPEGINNLKAKIAETMNVDLKLLALQIAYFRELVTENLPNLSPQYADLARTQVAAADAHIQQITEAYRELSQLKAGFSNAELNTHNLRSMQRWEEVVDTVVLPAQRFQKTFSGNPLLLTPQQLEDTKGRIFPFLTPPAEFDSAAVKREMDIVLQRNGLH